MLFQRRIKQQDCPGTVVVPFGYQVSRFSRVVMESLSFKSRRGLFNVRENLFDLWNQVMP